MIKVGETNICGMAYEEVVNEKIDELNQLFFELLNRVESLIEKNIEIINGIEKEKKSI